MKRKNDTALLALCLFFITAFMFTSCEKNLFDPNSMDETVDKLIIPESQDWKTMKDASCSITSEYPSIVSIYLDDSCSEDQLLATLKTGTGISELPICIPNHAKNIYMKYSTADGKQVIEKAKLTTDGTANFTLSNAKDNGNDENGDAFINYPNSGWGTIMFEDMFPSLGDYDFNDFVGSYIIRLNGSYAHDNGNNNQDNEGNNNHFKAESVTVALEIKAIGGTKKFTPCLKMNIKKESISYMDINNNINSEAQPVIEYSPDGYAIINFKGITKNLNMASGSDYLNTDKEHITTKLARVQVTIEFQEEINSKKLKDSDFEFYLVEEEQANGIEIHLADYKPVSYKYPSDNQELSSKSYYRSADNFVWGMKVPAPIGHTVEATDFLKAYPKFKDWVTDPSGNTNAKWWETKNSNYLIQL